MRLLISIPSRGRPQECKEAVERFWSLTHDKENTRIVCTLDADDPKIGDYQCIHTGELLIANSKNKIEAINFAPKKLAGEWDVVLCASDDLVPLTDGYDQAIRTDFANDADTLDATFWYADQNHRICCHPCLGSAYFQRDGYVYHPSYHSHYSDDEASILAQKRGKLFKSTSVKFEHRHPNYGNRKKDATDSRGNKTMMVDYHIFCRRQSQGFPKATI